MNPAQSWTPLEQLKTFARYLGRKMGYVALGWIVLWFATWWVSNGALALFGLIIGCAGGVVVGWYLAQDAVEKAGFTGLTLWIILVIASWIPMWVVEMILDAIFGKGDFARWMLLASATIMSMAAAVWRASADD